MKELISKKKNFKGMARIERLETQLLCSYASALENLQSQHALLKDLVTFTSNRATHLCKFRKSEWIIRRRHLDWWNYKSLAR